MKSVVIGIASGLAVSCGLLILLALWPLATETFVPPYPPAAAPTAPMTTDSPKPAETKADRPTPAQPIPFKNETPAAPKGPDASPKNKPARPPTPGKPAAKPNPDSEPTKTVQTVRETAPLSGDSDRSKPAETATIAPAPSPAPQFSPDLNAVNALLDRLRSAYSEKNLTAIKELSFLSGDDEELLKKIFNYYKTLQVDADALKTTESGVATAVVIRSLENEKGNVVIPSPKWGKQPLLITPQNNRWDQVRFLSSPSGASIDLAAPTILHALPMYAARPGEALEISATITDNAKVAAAALRFRASGDPKYESTPMSEGPDHTYSARIPGSMIKGNNIEYYIEARDAEGNLSMEGRPSSPLAIAVLPSKNGNE
ncbi:MAG: hypothetical protein HY204_04240 [Nitrospirae bacterium]|nr:hypothetical protein [Nitrospirota bacterium]